MGILELLGWGRSAPPERASAAETETVRKIVAALDRMEPGRARRLAAFAYLLGRVANADLEISEDETREMERVVRETGQLPEEQAVLVVHMAKTRAVLFGGVENFLVAREFGQISVREEKIALLHCLFSVSAADRSVSSAEDTTIRQIASELQLDHADYVAAKSAFRDRLAVLRRREPPASAG